MRKAKVAALIAGGVSTCLFGGLLGVYATSPVVSSVAPGNDANKVYDLDSEELANIAAVTSISTTAVTTTSRTTTTTTSATTAETTTEAPVVTTEAVLIEGSAVAEQAEAAYIEENTEPVVPEDVEPETEAPAVEVEDEIIEAPAEEDSNIHVEETTEPVIPTDIPVVTPSTLPISDIDYVMLCNAVANEAGSNWISVTEKAYVVEVIMNRVYSSLYPDDIRSVLLQNRQFTGASGYINYRSFTTKVTDEVEEAVKLYFSNPEEFDQGYLRFYGDGHRNHFS
ncbi:MAG: cell wall hydrolase [Ruminococcus sp.]|jgi:hypothetical protein|nr:cell wall hydrolase [Ruminococcus sp.]